MKNMRYSLLPKSLLTLAALTLCAQAFATTYYWTRGLETTTDRDWSNLEHWTTTNPTDPDGFNTSAAMATSLPKAGDTIVYALNSGFAGFNETVGKINVGKGVEANISVLTGIGANASYPSGFTGEGNITFSSLTAVTDNFATNANQASGVNLSFDTSMTFVANTTTDDGFKFYFRQNPAGTTVTYTGDMVLTAAEGCKANITFQTYSNSNTKSTNIIFDNTVTGGSFRFTSHGSGKAPTDATRPVYTFKGSQSNTSGIYSTDRAQINLEKGVGAYAVSGSLNICGSTIVNCTYTALGDQIDAHTALQFGNPDKKILGDSCILGGTLNLNGTNAEELASISLWKSSNAGGGTTANSAVQGILDFGGVNGSTGAGISQTVMAQTFYLAGVGGNLVLDGSSFTLKNYVVGEDHLIFGEQLSKKEIGDTGTYALEYIDFYGYSSEEYYIKEVLLDDGTYVGCYEYIPTLIPEPSAFVAAFGFFALAFVAYRRK